MKKKKKNLTISQLRISVQQNIPQTKLRELKKWGTLQHITSTKETKKEKIAIPTGKIEKCEFEQI